MWYKKIFKSIKKFNAIGIKVHKVIQLILTNNSKLILTKDNIKLLQTHFCNFITNKNNLFIKLKYLTVKIFN